MVTGGDTIGWRVRLSSALVAAEMVDEWRLLPEEGNRGPVAFPHVINASLLMVSSLPRRRRRSAVGVGGLSLSGAFIPPPPLRSVLSAAATALCSIGAASSPTLSPPEHQRGSASHRHRLPVDGAAFYLVSRCHPPVDAARPPVGAASRTQQRFPWRQRVIVTGACPATSALSCSPRRREKVRPLPAGSALSLPAAAVALAVLHCH